MGAKLRGVLIDRNYQQDLPSLERILGVRLIPEGEVFWGDAWTNYGQEYNDMYFCEQGTLIHGYFADNCYTAPGQRILSFTWVESTNYYDFRYTEDGILRRAKVYNDGDLSLDEGLPLPEELRLAEERKDDEGEDNTTELIRGLSRTMIGQSFDEIAPDSKYYRYRIVREENEEREEDILPVVEPVPSTEAKVIIQNKERRRKQNRIALGVFLGLLILFRILVYIVYKQ